MLALNNSSIAANNSELNATVVDDGISINFAGISTSILFFITVTLNILVLYLFYRINNLGRKPFNVFMVNLILTDLVYVVWEDIFDIASSFHPTTFWSDKSDAVCSLYLYANYIIQAAACNAHLLITINRLWAIIFPISYKSNQKWSVFTAICAGMWIYVHIVVLPGYLNDLLYYREDFHITGQGCLLNSSAQGPWSIASMVLMLDVPLITIVAAYPFILYKHRQRQNDLRRLHPSQGTQTHPVSSVKPPQSHLDEEGASTTANGNRKSGRKVTMQPMLILTLLTLSVFLCWTPNAVVYMMYVFRPDLTDPTVLSIVIFLFNVQVCLDPVLFLIALSDLRGALFELLEKPLRWFKKKGLGA